MTNLEQTALETFRQLPPIAATELLGCWQYASEVNDCKFLELYK
jgi:hypothetical protein